MLSRDAALKINEGFYKAFNSRNLDLMKNVWQEDTTVACIHPGWEVLRGFDSIINSWSNIFMGSENLEIRLTEIEWVISPEVIWVSCQENLFALSLSGVQVSKVHATNLYKCVPGGWKMVLHHASSIPSVRRESQIDTA